VRCVHSPGLGSRRIAGRPSTPALNKDLENPRMKKLMFAAATVTGLMTALPAAAQFAKPEDAVKYRKSGMFLMNNHLGRVGAMVNGRVPWDAKAVEANAEIATMMSKIPFAAFVEGTDKGDTKAKPEIWTEMDKFRAASSTMQEEMAKLNAAAKTGNQDAIKAQFGKVAQSCKACHDNYRKE
jgi:cytochrome c556